MHGSHIPTFFQNTSRCLLFIINVAVDSWAIQASSGWQVGDIIMTGFKGKGEKQHVSALKYKSTGGQSEMPLTPMNRDILIIAPLSCLSCHV